MKFYTMTRISDSKFKLLEAEYFLEAAQEKQESYGPFLFNLSACLTAIVSVTDVMWHEFRRKNEGFAKWFKTEKKKLSTAGFDEIRHLRTTIVHKAGNLSDKIGRDHIAQISSDGFLQEQSGSNWVLRFNGKNEGLFDTCQRYIAMLRELVEYCEDNFKWYDEDEDNAFAAPEDEIPEDEVLENEMSEDIEVHDEDEAA